MQTWRAIPSFYCPLVTMKRAPDIGLFYVGELLFDATDEKLTPCEECGGVT